MLRASFVVSVSVPVPFAASVKPHGEFPRGWHALAYSGLRVGAARSKRPMYPLVPDGTLQDDQASWSPYPSENQTQAIIIVPLWVISRAKS